MENQNRLFVGNLSHQTTESELQDHFAAAGAVLNVKLMLDKFTGRSRGFAFIEFPTPEDAQRAVELLHGQDLGGRDLTVSIAHPREERAPRPSAGGGFRGGGGSAPGGFRDGGFRGGRDGRGDDRGPRRGRP